jgi:hypothetical protein
MANRKSRVASGHERDVIPLLSHLDDLERVASRRVPVAGLPRRRVQPHVCELPTLVPLTEAGRRRRIAARGGFAASSRTELSAALEVSRGIGRARLRVRAYVSGGERGA